MHLAQLAYPSQRIMIRSLLPVLFVVAQLPSFAQKHVYEDLLVLYVAI